MARGGSLYDLLFHVGSWSLSRWDLVDGRLEGRLGTCSDGGCSFVRGSFVNA